MNGSVPQMSTMAQRPRLPFMWQRLMSRNASTFPVLKSTITINTSILNMLLDMNRDEPCVARNAGKIEAVAQESVKTLVYKQKDVFTGWAIGRAYTANQLAWLPRRVTNTLFKLSHQELDIVACMPTILAGAFSHCCLTSLRELATSPDSIYRSFHDLGVERTKVKLCVNALIGSYPEYVADYGLGPDEIEAQRVLGGSEFVNGLKRDLVRIDNEMVASYPEFVQAGISTGKTKGALMCIFTQDIEHAIMRSVIKKICGDDPVDILWMFDGLLLPHEKLDALDVDDLSNHVRAKIGLDVRFTTKSLSGNSIGISLSSSELSVGGDDAAYQAWKKRIEKEYFVMINPPTYCWLQTEGIGRNSIVEMCDSKLKIAMGGENQEFVKRWKTDPARRVYVCRDFAPPPLQCSPRVYNLWSGIAAASIAENEEDVDLSPYMDHVRLLCGSNDEYAEYFHKLLAFKVQFPGYIWRVMPFIRSTQGVGKDLFFDFLVKLFGETNSLKLTRFGDLLDKATHLAEGKLMICFSETEFSDSSKFMDKLKNMITSQQFTVQKKYVNDYEIRACACFIAFSNNFGAIPIQPDDRRFFVLTADGKFAQNADYFNPLIEWMSLPSSVRAVYDYYMAMDLSLFNPSAERPVTKAHKEMSQSRLCIMDMVIKRGFPMWMDIAKHNRGAEGYGISNDITLKIPRARLWDDFQALARDLQINRCDSRKAMESMGTQSLAEACSRMKRYKTVDSMEQVVEKYRSHGSNFFKFDIQAVRQYIEKMIGEEEVDSEEGIGEIVTSMF